MANVECNGTRFDYLVVSTENFNFAYCTAVQSTQHFQDINELTRWKAPVGCNKRLNEPGCHFDMS